MKRQCLKSVALFVSFASSSSVAAAAAPVTPAGLYADECGACHLAYPARLLPPAGWASVLAQLDRHYGVDASLDAQAAQAISLYLRATAADKDARTTALPRITTQPWFREEHDEVASSVFTSRAVGSASNCSACHTGAEHGNFDEHSVRIPR